MRLRAALAACVPLLGLARVADSTEVALADLMQQFAARTQRHASFAERDELALLKRPLESSGELFYTAPDRLEKRTLAPKPESLVLDHGSVAIARGKHTYTLALRDAPAIAPFIESIRATLAGDLPALERTYTVTFTTADEDWTLDLVPRGPELAALFRVIRMHGRAADMRSVEVRRANGDRSFMTIRDLER